MSHRMPKGPEAPRPELEPHEKLAQDYVNAFTSESGKRVLDDLRKSFGRRSSHAPGDPYTTAYNEGRRDVYLRIMTLIDPEQFDEEAIL